MRGRTKLAAIGGAVALAAAGYAAAATVTVTLGASGPVPTVVTADWGDTLAVVNGDSVTLGITSPRTDLRTTAVAPGATYTSVVTSRAGSLQYRQTGGSKSFVGTIVVLATGSVSLTARPAQVLFGRSVQLRGVVTKLDTPVVLEERNVGESQWRTAATLTSAGDGSFSTALRLETGAKLRATIDGGQVHSPNVAVGVLPRLSIAVTPSRTQAGHTVAVRVRVTPPSAATRVTVSTCNDLTGHWRDTGSRRPAGGGVAVFRVQPTFGRTHLRASIARRDTAPGFDVRTSSSVTVIATGKPPRAKKRAPHRC